MFMQVHMLQSVPPGNLNRDESGQPKKCVFGGVTRGRISSQCLKRNIRLSAEFREAFGDSLAARTQYLPRMVHDELAAGKMGVPDDELNELMAAIAGQFSKGDTGDDDEGKSKSESSDSASAGADKTPQLVFFPPPFARRIAELVVELRKRNPKAYDKFIGRKVEEKKEEAKPLKDEVEAFIERIAQASKSHTVDIAFFGRMTTSELVVNVEAACQVAHAISTHETLIESDYFTAMDELKGKYAPRQADSAGAAFLGSGETETFFNAAVYYKYLNLDVEALKKRLPSLSDKDAAQAAAVLVSAAALANPTGKQNSFAAHGATELILVEMSKAKRPLSYANAFLQAVEGKNLMTESAKALYWYIDSTAKAFAPAETERVLLAVGHASTPSLGMDHIRVDTLEELIKALVRLLVRGKEA
jgi:CRISPR system Cascade subunit CasC